MKKVYIITHGDNMLGANLGHTKEGLNQIKALPIPKEISLVVIGTGVRQREIYTIHEEKLVNVPVKVSPFCGSTDSFSQDKKFVLADGTLVEQEDYIGIKCPDVFDAWKFIEYLPDRTLLCSSGELFNALSLGNSTTYRKGGMYEINAVKKTAIAL
jgi:hypothetical protein